MYCPFFSVKKLKIKQMNSHQKDCLNVEGASSSCEYAKNNFFVFYSLLLEIVCCLNVKLPLETNWLPYSVPE